VGTGLIIGSGTALQRAGPLRYLVMVSLGEMSAYLPNKKGFTGFAGRFVDPALGFALGYNYLFKYLIVAPNNINAAGIVIRYWDTQHKVHIAVWMIIFIALVFLVNMLGVRVFGELEFWLSSIKVITLTGLIIFGIVVDLGGNPKHDRIGFRYWEHPYGPMGIYLKKGSLGIFLGFWFVIMINALFAYIGTELIGVTVGEAENPRENVPKAIRRTFWRIAIFYVGSVFVVGLIVPRTSPELFVALKSSTGAAASPFIVAANILGIKALGHIINACILVFVMSAANSDLYIGSRTLFALAAEGQAPAIFRRVNSQGVPWPALILCTLFCSLTFLNVTASASQVFGYFTNLVTLFGAITWMCILYSHLRFMQALKAQGISRDDLPYKAPFQPYGNYFALISTGIIAFFKGFDTFMPWNKTNFVTSYIGFPVFFVLWIGYKIVFKTRVVPLKEVDLISGKRVIDDAEADYSQKKAAQGPQTWWQAFVASL
ncbi:hypothetical protein BS47DRAFT_1286143, partial [Hydnum rufescens UP504]